MRNLISILVTIALVLATTVAPSISHAMPHHGEKATQTLKTEASKGHDCQGHGGAKADSQTHKDKDASGKCCDKGMCKCVGGTCHNGLSQIFGNSGDMLVAFYSSQSRFGSADEFADSAFLEGLKRPPRA
jgi:hypothetical protein